MPRAWRHAAKIGQKMAKDGISDEYFMKKALEEAKAAYDMGEVPVGAVVVFRGKVIARAHNMTETLNDPTAHAEINAIRKACKKLKTFNLNGCEIYTSCEPCPMCLSAIYWAHIDRIYYGNSQKDAEKIGFDDAFIYRELATPPIKRKLKIEKLLANEAIIAFQEWEKKKDKIEY